MNEAVFFKTADYTKNENLVMDDNTIYEVDPECLAHSSRQNRETNEETRMDALEQEFVRGIDVECTEHGKENRSKFIKWMFLILLICFCKHN